jgi:hypothetical protein
MGKDEIFCSVELESTIKFEDSTQTMKDIYSKIPTFIAGLF